MEQPQTSRALADEMMMSGLVDAKEQTALIQHRLEGLAEESEAVGQALSGLRMLDTQLTRLLQRCEQDMLANVPQVVQKRKRVKRTEASSKPVAVQPLRLVD